MKEWRVEWLLVCFSTESVSSRVAALAAQGATSMRLSSSPLICYRRRPRTKLCDNFVQLWLESRFLGGDLGFYLLGEATESLSGMSLRALLNFFSA